MMESTYQKGFTDANKLDQLATINQYTEQLTNTTNPPQWMSQTRNYAQNYKPDYSSTKIYGKNKTIENL